MNGNEKQLNIFELIPAPDINDVTEDEAVRIVGDRLGVTFAYNEFFGDWRAKRGNMTMALSYGRFFPGVFDGRLFLGADYNITRGGGFYTGGSCPCDGIDEATEYLERAMAIWSSEL